MSDMPQGVPSKSYFEFPTLGNMRACEV